ncbi:putative carbohydrate-binding protein with CBM48 [Arcticibacter tournemirensis]|uniref:1,4-alpha-glucan-branching protein n=1 Tax=Arcticibacter tournemirensis TaxID=699437 RepID=A0A5M9HBJ2_9SPHI|nr:alpha-amylase family glycosyl hydrolase [Arcticibacter tournemirensis]KAA8484362.1 1,4-alpha-glucan-branching protein [Arcticibacter tournemirensis]TQM49801.1 putative carbohydrate-binding protein with CBM48 [Arcticibacter tournemirensis]
MKKIIVLFLLPLLIISACKKRNPAEDPEIPGTEIPAGTEAGLMTFAPYFPSGDEALTITLDASKGNEGLKGISGDVYIYAGLITDKSTGPGDWKYVKSSSFNTADPASKMTPAGNNIFKITLTPRSFFNVPPSEKILKVVMVFRNTDGSRVARNKDNSDIYLPLTEAGKLAVRFITPEFEPLFTPEPAVKIQMLGQELSVTAVSSKAADLTLTLNGTSFATAANTTSISGKVSISGTGSQLVKVRAADGSATAEASFTLAVNGTVQEANLPAGARDGVTFINGGRSAIVSLYAPGKQFAYLIGDFNEWKADAAYFMKRTPDGNRWWIQVDNLNPQTEYAYQFWVDGMLKVADPYCEKVLDPQNDSYIPASTYPGLKAYPTGKTTGIVSVMQGTPASYSWRTTNFNRPQKKDLVIYELHLRDFLSSGNYSTLKDTLNYLSRLGVNAIELMPVNEFEGNSSWGYNTSFYFAADKYYGTKVALQAFIDECHTRGIAVILDMVLNHSFGQSPMVQLYFDNATGKPSANSPWFNANPTHPFNVGYDFNHESAATKHFVKNVIEFWMKEYKVDGFRFDLSKGFTQKNSGTSDASVNAWSAYDGSRVQIWKEYNTFIKSIDPDFYVILEHFAADAEEKELSDAGMLLWNNLNYNFNEATMGYVANSDFSRAFYDRHSFTQPYNLVTYMESHDEERLMYKNLQYGNVSGTYSIKNLNTALKRQQLAAAFLLAVPGPKMIWQFGELGYDVSIEQNGRTGEKPIHWEYKSNSGRKELYSVYSKLIKLKKSNAVFSSTNFQYSLNSGVKYIVLKSPTANVFVVGNFDVVSKQASIDLPIGGNWYDCLSDQTISVSGSSYSSTLAPGEYHIYSSTPLY